MQSEQACETFPRYFDNINLDNMEGYMTIYEDSIMIAAHSLPSPSTGRIPKNKYRAHIKWDPNATWEDHIGPDPRDWEAATMRTPIWEVAVGWDGNYEHDPSNHRPKIRGFVEFLREQGEEAAAKRIEEAYALD